LGFQGLQLDRLLERIDALGKLADAAQVDAEI
jgi:hypothetical protein